MEFHTPSMFDENGFNILSPVVQGGGVGYVPTPSFKYNGGDVYETQIQNQQRQYYENLGNSASAMLQAANNPQMRANTGYVNSYNPYQNQWGNNGFYNTPYNNNAQYNTGGYSSPFGYGYSNNTQYTGYGNGYYNDQYNDPYNSRDQWQKAMIYNDAYQNGLISLTDYCTFNNGQQLSFIGVDGKNHTVGGNSVEDNWYGTATSIFQRQQDYVRMQQEEYEEQMAIWDMCLACYDRYYGRDPEEEKQKRISYMEYQQKWQAHRIKEAREEYENDCIVEFIRSLPNSTQKDYVSPLKRDILEAWNRCYHERNDKYPEHYGLEEYFNGGIMANQIMDLMEDDMKKRERQLNRLYDQQEFRNFLHSRHPDYDPITGISSRGARRLGIDDLEIKLPPNLCSQEYQERRHKFIESIMKDNRYNLQTKY